MDPTTTPSRRGPAAAIGRLLQRRGWVRRVDVDQMVARQLDVDQAAKDLERAAGFLEGLDRAHLLAGAGPAESAPDRIGQAIREYMGDMSDLAKPDEIPAVRDSARSYGEHARRLLEAYARAGVLEHYDRATLERRGPERFPADHRGIPWGFAAPGTLPLALQLRVEDRDD